MRLDALIFLNRNGEIRQPTKDEVIDEIGTQPFISTTLYQVHQSFLMPHDTAESWGKVLPAAQAYLKTANGLVVVYAPGMQESAARHVNGQIRLVYTDTKDGSGDWLRWDLLGINTVPKDHPEQSAILLDHKPNFDAEKVLSAIAEFQDTDAMVELMENLQAAYRLT